MTNDPLGPGEWTALGALPQRPLVVLLHGLARTERSMAGLAGFLESHDLQTWRCTWPSRTESIAQAAALVHARLQAEFPGRPLQVVTHSLGAAVALHLAQLRPMQRAVLLAPPLRGSRVARTFANWKLFRWFYGPAGGEVAVAGPGWPGLDQLGEVAIIAGNRALALTNPVSWATRSLGVLPASLASDGTVALDETRPEGPHHFAEVGATHTWIMNDTQVQQMVLQFLQCGRLTR